MSHCINCGLIGDQSPCRRCTAIAAADTEVRKLRSDLLDALSSLDNIERLLQMADRLEGDGRTGWVTTSAVRIAGGF